MSALKAYKKGFQFLCRHLSLWGAFYLIILVFALLIATPFHSYLTSSIGDSLEITRHTSGYDFGFIQGFLIEYGDGITMLFQQSKWIILLFLILSVFTTSGLVSIIVDYSNDFSFGNFLRGGTQYFWPYFRMAIYFILFLILLLYILVKIFEAVAGGLSVFEIENDILMNRTFYVLLAFFSIIVFTALLILDTAKIEIARNRRAWIYKNLLAACRLVFINLTRFFGFYLMIFLSFAGLSMFYYQLENLANSLPNLLLLFFFSQCYILFRIALRFINLAGIDQLYKDSINEGTQV